LGVSRVHMEPSAHHAVREPQLQFQIEDLDELPHGSGTDCMHSPPDASVQQQPEGEAEAAEASARARRERRVDPACPQGESYTRAEFRAFYGSLEQWHAAAPLSSGSSGTPQSGGAAAGSSDSPYPRASALPPGWSKITDYGKIKGYRGPDGKKVTTKRAAWRLHEEAAEETGASSETKEVEVEVDEEDGPDCGVAPPPRPAAPPPPRPAERAAPLSAAPPSELAARAAATSAAYGALTPPRKRQKTGGAGGSSTSGGGVSEDAMLAAAAAADPEEIVTTIVCDGCEAEFELLPGEPVPDGDWFCAACKSAEPQGAAATATATGSAASSSAAASGAQWQAPPPPPRPPPQKLPPKLGVGARVRVKGKGYGVVLKQERDGDWLTVQLDSTGGPIKAQSTAVFATGEGQEASAPAGGEAARSGGTPSKPDGPPSPSATAEHQAELDEVRREAAAEAAARVAAEERSAALERRAQVAEEKSVEFERREKEEKAAREAAEAKLSAAEEELASQKAAREEEKEAREAAERRLAEERESSAAEIAALKMDTEILWRRNLQN